VTTICVVLKCLYITQEMTQSVIFQHLKVIKCYQKEQLGLEQHYKQN